MNGKQLKNSILQWAIQGKLVPQDPNDEPASVLLERIRAEKAQLIKEGKIKKDKNETIIFRGDDNSHYEKLPNGEVRCIDDEIPFEIPSSWAWCAIGNLVSIRGGKRLPVGATFSEIPTPHIYIRVTEMKNNTLVDTQLKFISENLYQLLKSYTINETDLYLTIAGTIGQVGIVPNKFDGMNLTENAVKLTNIPVNKLYLMYAISSDCVQTQFSARTNKVGQPKLAIERIKTTLLPIPPLSEQQRIVEQIEQILPIVERYDKAQVELDLLNTDIYSLLKKSILQEAIQGRLVPQDPNNEPSTKLLERIRTEKQALVKQGKLKAKDITDSIIYEGDDNKYYEKCGNAVACIDDEIPFEVPNTWSWCRLGDLISTKTGLAYSKPNLEIRSNNMVRVLRGGNIFNGSWCMKSDDVMISSEFVKQDLYLRKGYFITPAVTSWENMGKTALVRENYDNVVVGGFVLMMCPFYTDEIVEEYLNYFFQSTMFQQYCQSITNKSGQAFYNLSRNKLLQKNVFIID